MKTIEKVYQYAIEHLNNDLLINQNKYNYEGFEVVAVYFSKGSYASGDSEARYVKIMKKDIGFSFTIYKNDLEDLERMQFVYDVSIASNNHPLLLNLAKKQKTKFDKIKKKFPHISKEDYDFDIHSKSEVIKFIQKCLS